MQHIRQFISCLFGPRLYRIYVENRQTSVPYTGNALECWSDNIIKLINLTYTMTIYTSPLIIIALYRRGYFSLTPQANIELSYLILRVIYTASILGVSSYCLRSFGRLMNDNYRQFINKYNQINLVNEKDIVNRSLYTSYDFDFKYWPVEYSAYTSELTDKKKLPQPLITDRSYFDRNIFSRIVSFPLELFYSFVVHTIGRRMIYPGSVALLQLGINEALNDGRRRLVEKFLGERFKITTLDGNYLDTMFIDRRSISPKGNTLVICSEGNAGFYEVGIMATPIEAGYSVLGWNHPGFAYSSGYPFPEQIINAIDAVIKFARDKLKFEFSNIVLFGWSIGGYPATWAAMQYPEIKSLIMDASFDDILPLAVSKMPPSWKPLVRNVIRRYFDLNISLNLNYYNGPVLFIRRLRDEIIFTNESDPVASNRANNLLINLLKHRFTGLIDDDVYSVLFEWLSRSINTSNRNSPVNRIQIDDRKCYQMLKKMIDDNNGIEYPLKVGDMLTADDRVQLALFLASKHLLEFDSTHCTQLPVHLFNEPWDLFNILKHSKL